MRVQMKATVDAILLPEAAQAAAVAVPGKTTWRKYTVVQDKYELDMIADIINKCDAYVTSSDSGSKDKREHVVFIVTAYVKEEDKVVRFGIGVPRVVSPSGQLLDIAKAEAFVTAGIDERHESAHTTDTCAAEIGIFRSKPDKSRGAIQIMRCRTGNGACSDAHCLCHIFDLVLRKALMAMSGFDNKL